MSLQFINLSKALKAMGVHYVGTTYGLYGATTDNLRKHKIWVAVNEAGNLVCSKNLLNAGNTWLDDLADLKNNDYNKYLELVG